MTGIIESVAAGSDFSPRRSNPLTNFAADYEEVASEEDLAKRYKNRWTGKQEELTFEFTRDPALLHQYYRIYEDQFRAVHNAQKYHHSAEDEHDKRSHVIIVRSGNLCVGGARLTTKTPRKPYLLPVEIDGFRFEDHFPHLATNQLRYAQIGRFCLLPEFRGGVATQVMLEKLYRKSVALGMDVIFGTAPLLNARVYMQNFVSMGLKGAKIHFNIKLPDYPMCEEIKFYLISVAVDKPSLKKASRQEVTQSLTAEEQL